MEITVTDMSKSLSDIISRVYYKGETFNIKKGRNVFARVSPISTIETLQIQKTCCFLNGIPIVDIEFNCDLDRICVE